MTGKEEREWAREQAKNEDIELLNEHIERTREVTLNWDSCKILKVEKEIDDSTRYVVQVPADSESDNTAFVQYNGFDMLKDPSALQISNSMPNSIGFVGDRSTTNVPGQATQGINSLKVENNEIRFEKIKSGMTLQSNEILPCCGGGGSCETCWVETGVNCSPSFECMIQIVAAVGGTIGACAHCVLSWPPGLYCAWCMIVAYASLDEASCLGCDDTEWQCVPSDIADTVCS